MRCPVCDNEVPAGEYCGVCGAELATRSAFRLGAFAADPTQHVVHPDIVSTLFPHLPQRHSTPFRLGLLLTAALLLVLGVLRLTGPAIGVAAAAVPVLYALYLYEVDVYERQPVPVIGLTLGLGLLLGIPWAIVTGPIITHTLLHDITTGISFTNVLVEGVLFPLAAQALMLAGAVALFLRGHFREPVDGFTFGAAGALGFTLSTTLVNLGPELRGGLITGAPALTNALTVLSRGLLIPFLTASTTGLIAGALWMTRRPKRSLADSWTTSLPVAVAAAAIVDSALGIVGITILHPGLVVAIYLVVAAALLIWVRLSLHWMLLAEARDAQIGPQLPCPNCHRVVPRMAFCPHCGIASAATPKIANLVPAAPSGSDDASGHTGPYPAATPEELSRLKRGSPRLARASAGGVVMATAVTLGLVAAITAPTRHAACHLLCVPPPPPCLGACKRAASPPPLRTSQSYTSSTYGYSVDYTEFAPSHQDNSSIEWDLSTDVGPYTVQEVGANPGGRSAQRLLDDVVSNNFQDYNHVYDVPGAEIGYTAGAGAVYDDQVAPFFGVASDTRLVVMTATKKNLAIVLVGDGDAATAQGGRPDATGLPISPFVDSLADATRWPGDPPR